MRLPIFRNLGLLFPFYCSGPCKRLRFYHEIRLGITPNSTDPQGIINPMDNDAPRHAAASRDEYSLTITDVAARYEAAGFPRTIRTLQRYCAKGHLARRKGSAATAIKSCAVIAALMAKN